MTDSRTSEKVPSERTSETCVRDLAALIRERYTRDNWNGLTYDEAMAVAAALDGCSPETCEQSSDGPCQELDGCPTEMAVLKRFWREHHRDGCQHPLEQRVRGVRQLINATLCKVCGDYIV